MEIETYKANLLVKNTIKAPSVKVCMHVLRGAREDVRAMRAATTLVHAGYEVSIIDIESESTYLPKDIMNGIHLRHIKISRSFIATRFRRWALINAVWVFVRSLLQLVKTPADIYHALDLPALPACYIASRLRRKPLIFESYEFPFSTLALYDMTTGRYLLQKVLMPVFNYIISRCAGVIVVSPPIATEMKKRYGLSKVSLVRNILPYQPVEKSDRLQRLLGLETGKRIALYQGYLQPGRGLDNLIRSAAFLEKDIVIVLMGKDQLGTQAQLETLIESEGVTDQVKIVPNVPYHDLLSWTASADLGLIVYSPAYSLTIQMILPNKLFEFLMAGVPVLASQLDAVEDIIKTYNVGQIVTSTEPAAVGAAINALLSDDMALRCMSQNALAAGRTDLNWEKESLQLIQLYKDIATKLK